MLWPEVYKPYYKKFVSEADVVIIFAGCMVSEHTEKFDRRSINLNPNYEMFIEFTKSFNDNVIVVLQNGSAIAFNDWYKHVPGLVEMWLGGEAAGGAVADILCGNINPSGKLSETFPNRMRTDLEYPGDGNKVEYKERFDVGYRYYDKNPKEILYPFGHGLSYTDFEYSDLSVNYDDSDVEISFNLKNIGSVDGAEVVQLYIGDPVTTVVKPIKELKKFKKIYLKSGEVKRVLFILNQSDYVYYNTMLRKYVAEVGRYDVFVGASSQDIRLSSFFIHDDEKAPYSINCIGETMIG